jgi:cbb3-type cytochrome oxidase maturation protein
MMTSTYFLIFTSLFLGSFFVAAFVWYVKSNQYKDIEAPKYQMLRDDD